MGYTKDAIKGFSWLGFLRLAIKGMSVVRIAILARLLTPSEFGIFGITVAILALVERLTETGVNTFLIQRRDELTTYLNSAWVISITRGTIICALMLSIAQLLAHFYSQPSLQTYITLASAIPFIKGFINPAEVKFWKHLQFKKEVLLRSVLAFVEAVGAVILTFMLHSALGLVYALILSALLEVLISQILISPRPKFVLNGVIIKMILRASTLLNAGGVLSFLVNNIDNFIVGKMLGITSLGYYQNGFNVVNSGIGDIGELSAQTVFPIYARIAEDRQRLKRAFLRALFPLMGLLLLPFLLVVGFPQIVVQVILGPQWLPAVAILPILGVAMYIKSLNAIEYPLYLAIGKPQYSVTILAIQLTVLVSLLLQLSRAYGLVGASVAVLGSYLIIQPLFFVFNALTLRETKASSILRQPGSQDEGGK